MHMTSVVWGQELAVGLMKEQFGDVVAQVVSVLIYQGPHAFPQLLRTTGLSPSLLKSALLVLIQQNCAAAYKDDSGKDADPNKIALPAPVMYAALLPRILHRLRHPRYMVHIRETYGERQEIVVQSLLEHGRLRADQIIEYTAAREGTTQEAAREGVEEAIAELVDAHYLERSPPCDRPPTSSDLGPMAPSKGKATRGPARQGSAAHAAAQAEAASANAQQARVNSERFRLPSHLQAVAVRVGKRKRGEAVPSSDAADIVGHLERDVLWRVNHDEFNRRFRHALCVNLVSQKVEPAAGAVMAAVLRVSREHERTPTEERSVPVSDLEIRMAMEHQAAEGLPAISKENVVPVLRLLLADTSELISQIGEMPDGGMTVCANLKRVMDLVRLKELEGAVRDRFGPSACRLFRLLTIKRQLEQKQIAEMAMLPVKDTREILYRLLKGGYVTLQEVAKTSDHNPQRTFYLWRVDIPKAVARLGAEILRATVNVRTRLAHELHSQKDVLELLEAATAAAQGGSGRRVVLTATQRHQLEYVRRVAAVLETRLLHLDDLLFLLHDA